jgi:hypothetical protein
MKAWARSHVLWHVLSLYSQTVEVTAVATVRKNHSNNGQQEGLVSVMASWLSAYVCV